MAAALLTPRVRLMTVCDRVRESDTEAGVYHLRGVRQGIVAQAFPFVASMRKKTQQKMRGPTLRQFELVPVTDPAEFAALDRRCRVAEKAMAAAERKAGKRKQ